MTSEKMKTLFQNADMSVLITSEQNIFYTTGFATAAKRFAQIGPTCAVLAEGSATLICPENWVDIVRRQVNASVRVRGYAGGMPELAQAVKRVAGPAGTLGFEMDGMELSLYLQLAKVYPDAEWVDVGPALRTARMVKKPEEINALRRSAKLACQAMEYVATLLRPGLEEQAVVAELEYFMRKGGSKGVPFTMKVLAGENATRTIHLPGGNQMNEGDIVLLDFGAIVDNYASDWTRSFALGRASGEQRELYTIVREIERSCIEMIRPGVRLAALMENAMEIAQKSRFASYFHPYLGHSIGIASQEWPAIVPGVQGVLQENMVITIEPGMYVPGLGGVRIEDEIWVTANGHEVFTGLDDERFVLPL